MYGPILKSKKIILKPPKISEAKQYLKWLKDPDVSQYIGSFVDLTLEQEKEYLKKIKTDDSKIFWSIYTKSGKHIGSTDLHDLVMPHKRTSWGIMIGDKNEWDKGYGSDALKTILSYAFKQLKLNRFELEVFHKNKRGIKCYQKCGFKKEGIRKKYFIKNNQIYDSIMMSIIK